MPWTKVYEDRSEFAAAVKKDPNLRGLTYRDAILEASTQLLEHDKDFFILGEGVDDPGGVFGTTKGLADRFGDKRVMDTPLAENGVTGIAMGAALTGLRPLLVHMRVDFMTLSLDQIANHAAKWGYMFAGAVKVPLTIRAIIGRGWGSAAQHSQCLQAMFTSVPGLKVVMPATPYDAKGLLTASVYDDNPVIFIEHRALYEQIGHVPEEPYKVELGKAIVRQKGSDVTIVASSQMVTEAMKAGRQLKNDGIECEIIDLRTLKPMDRVTILGSVNKTGRLVIADNGWKEGGYSASVSAIVSEEAFSALKAPIQRVALPNVPTPASHVLEAAYYKSYIDIIEAVKRITG